jgi:hypothetical protein
VYARMFLLLSLVPIPAWWRDGWGYIACPGCRQCAYMCCHVRTRP